MGIAYEERNIRQDPRWFDELLRTGAQATPTTVVMRSAEQRSLPTVIVGFRAEQLRAAIDAQSLGA